MDIVVKQAQDITTVAPQRIDELVDSFIEAQDVKQSSKKLYRRTLKQYFNWVTTKDYLLSEIARPQIIEYKEDLLSSGMSSLTVGSYITSVRRFYEWTEANKFYPNVAKGIKTPKRKQQFKKQPLLPEQATALLNYYEDKAPRDYAIVNLLLRAGLRTIEVIRANVEDITFKGSQRVLLVHGKGRDEKDNFVILTDKTFKPIEAYLNSRGKVNSSEPLFISKSNNSNGERLTTRTISYIAKEGLKAIGLDNKSFTAHSLRHTTAVNILRAGGSLEMAQFTLRHTNPATTQIYTATLNEERRLQNSGEALIDSLY
ncbi:MAG: Tyrosine recombinase XerD [Porticoccaceae bacterium UBA1117]|nr:MAG: Tyrosine recombinase XerD [Porticoccaceae bacterium UBA1117]